MKNTYLAIAFASLSLFSVNSYADKIVVQGEPVVIQKQGDYYVFPSTYTATTGPYFVSVNDNKQVCYKEVQPALANVDLGIMQFKMGNDTVSVHCYTYSPDYFVVP